MQADKWWGSALWGRLGAAIILLATAALRGQGIDISQDQMDAAHKVVGNLIDNIYLVIAAAMVIVSRFRSVKKVKGAATAPETKQAGSIKMALLAVIMGVAVGLGASFILGGCAHQTATGQIAEQTADPGTIALAVFADAQDAYIEAAELYLPYQATMQKNNPALDREIREIFRKADKILTDWQLYGDVPAGDKEAFRAYLREISIMAAQALDGKL